MQRRLPPPLPPFWPDPPNQDSSTVTSSHACAFCSVRAFYLLRYYSRYSAITVEESTRLQCPTLFMSNEKEGGRFSQGSTRHHPPKKRPGWISKAGRLLHETSASRRRYIHSRDSLLFETGVYLSLAAHILGTLPTCCIFKILFLFW